MKNWVKLIKSGLMIEFPGESFLFIIKNFFFCFPGFLVNSAFFGSGGGGERKKRGKENVN